MPLYSRLVLVLLLQILLGGALGAHTSHAAGTTDSTLKRVNTFLNKLAKQGYFSGEVVIARHGHVLLSRGYGLADWDQEIPNTPATPMHIGSLTMEFTAAAILQLQDAGKLKVSENICTYISNCPAAWKSITIHDLLGHMSGIPSFSDFPFHGNGADADTTPAQTIAPMRSLPLRFKPGTHFGYSNSNYILLGTIIEAVSGTTYGAYLQSHIFDPLHMRHTGYTPTNEPGSGDALGYSVPGILAPTVNMSIPYAAAGMYSTAQDLGIWDRALSSGRVLSDKASRQMFTAYRGHYGYGWFVGKPFDHAATFGFGIINGFEAVNTRYSAEKLQIILLCNQESIPLDLIWYEISNDLFHAT